MKRTFDIHVVIGNTQIILKGAEEYSVITKPTQPQLGAKAPKGGQTVFTQKYGSIERDGIPGPVDAAVTVHEIISVPEQGADQLDLSSEGGGEEGKE